MTCFTSNATTFSGSMRWKSIYMYICMYVHTYVCMYVCVCVGMYILPMLVRCTATVYLLYMHVAFPMSCQFNAFFIPANTQWCLHCMHKHMATFMLHAAVFVDHKFVLWNLNVHFAVQSSPHFVITLSHMQPADDIFTQFLDPLLILCSHLRLSTISHVELSGFLAGHFGTLFCNGWWRQIFTGHGKF
jgi:hypothetical protein